MALVLETGSGVRGANSYVTVAFVTAYLTDRGREAENSWSTIGADPQAEACVAATDYIDSRWGTRFNGIRQFSFLGAPAQGLVDITSNPSNSETITIGEVTYTFVTTLAEFGSNEVLIGATVADTATNLVAAIGATSTLAGTGFSTSQQYNTSAVAAIKSGTTDEIVLTAINPGLAGNDIPLSDTAAGITLTAFANGAEAGSQPLEFPRKGLVDASGRLITGIPDKLRQATAEYAVRSASASASLFRDPTVDDTGRAVLESDKRAGPLVKRVRYEEGGGLATLIKPFPAADKLLSGYVSSGGGTYR